MENIESNEPEPPPSCDHEEWTLGCERCFYEMKNIALDKIKVNDVQQAQYDTINGAILFGWHMISILADLDIQLVGVSTRTLDLTQRETALTVLNNVRNISKHVVGVCTNPRRLENVLISAGKFAQQMNEAVKQTTSESSTEATQPPPPSRIILTDK